MEQSIAQRWPGQSWAPAADLRRFAAQPPGRAPARARPGAAEAAGPGGSEGVIEALLLALGARDTETEGHSERVGAYTVTLAAMLGVAADEMLHIEHGALLHDIGKIAVPDRILFKPGRLTAAEWQEMKQHPVVGHRMCWPITSLRRGALVVRHHHERWDGAGYPDGLRGERIPLGARIFAVADALDAMTTDRPYRRALSWEDATRELASERASQFDPRVVDAFLSAPLDYWMRIRSATPV